MKKPKKKKAASKPKSRMQMKKIKSVLVPIKIPPRQLLALKAQARRFAKGNLSAWLRHAGLRYSPKRGEVVYTVSMPSIINRHYRKS